MILLTGASGFIGGHLLNFLIDVYGSEHIVVLTSKPTTKCQYLLHNGYTFDDDLFIKNGYGNIETIIHAGAFTPKSSIDSNNIIGCYGNIKNTTKLLTSRLKKIKKFVYLSSLDVYDYSNTIEEYTLLNPESLYGHSKLYCEKLVKIWADEKIINHQILRIGHIYGPGEEEYQKLIPNTIRDVINNIDPVVFNGGIDLRSYIHVSDCCRLIIRAIELSQDVGPINIASDQSMCINDIVKLIIRISNKDLEIKYKEGNIISRNVTFNNAKMNKFLGVELISIDQGLLEEYDLMKKKLPIIK